MALLRRSGVDPWPTVVAYPDVLWRVSFYSARSFILWFVAV